MDAMVPRYREDKATQVAAMLIGLRGGKMSHLKLMKLLYLVDRTALIRWGRPVTYDRYVSMPHGPVLSYTLDRINSEVPPEGESYWQRYISPPDADYEVRLLRRCPVDQLSPAEEALVREVFEQFGHLSRWQIRDYTHQLPEWRDPQGSSIELPIEDILKAGGLPDDEIEAIMEELGGVAAADYLLGD